MARMTSPIDFNHAINDLTITYEELIGLFGEENRSFFLNNVFLAGGAITSLLHKEVPNDYDFYCKDKESLEKLEFLIWKHFKNKSLIDTDNAWTINSNNDIVLSKTFQFIKFVVGSPKEITDSFDFTHCMAWYDPSKSYIYFNHEFVLKNIQNKRLFYNIHSSYPLAAISRINRFVQKGFNISREEIVKICQCLKLYDLFDKDVLTDQTRGFYSSNKTERGVLVDKFLSFGKEIRKVHASKFKSDFKRLVNQGADDA